MESLLTYIIQINLLLALLYLGYQLLLKNLTFYRLNRIYLMLGTLYAFIYPFLDINSWFAKKIELPQGIIMEYFPMVFEPKEEVFSLSDLLVYLTGIGVIVLFVKLAIQLGSLIRIHWYSRPSRWREYFFRNVVFPITPFSFFNKIYVHKEQHQDLELQDIFKHEYVHVKGHHSIDVLLFEIVLVCCWYNPFVWYMRKAVRENLEFLTDQQVLDKGVDRQSYQYSLLHVTKQGASVGISNQFNFKTLKKRIMMMNKKRSSKLELGKYVFLLPILIIAGITFTVNQAEAKIETVVIKLQETDLKQKIKKAISIELQNDTTKRDSGQVINTKEYFDMVSPGVSGDGSKRPGKSVSMVNVFLLDTNKNPLYVLDGEKLPKNFKSGILNPIFFESMEVLKGESATALYGEDGKNGVILITTKKEAATKGFLGDNLREKVSGIVTRKRISSDSLANKTFSRMSLKEFPEGTKFFINGKESVLERFNEINPNDLESIEIIKDANGIKKPSVKIITKEFAKENGNEPVVVAGKPVSGAARITLKGEPASEPARIILKGEPSRITVAGQANTDEGQTDQAQKATRVPPMRSQYRKWTFSESNSTEKLLTSQNIHKAYFLIDGKKSSYKDLKKLDVKKIKFLQHLPPSDTLKSEYGKKGAQHGVVIVRTQ